MFQSIYLHFHKQRVGIWPYRQGRFAIGECHYYPVIIPVFGFFGSAFLMIINVLLSKFMISYKWLLVKYIIINLVMYHDIFASILLWAHNFLISHC